MNPLRFPKLVPGARTASLVMLGLLAGSVHAGQAAPWDAALQTVVGWLTGPTASFVIIIAAALAIYGLFFSEGGNVWRKLGYVGFGAALLGVIANVVSSLFAGGAALLG